MTNPLKSTSEHPITLRLTAALLASMLITGCSSLRFPGVFKIDIGQGNIVAQEKLDQLYIGMTQDQVVYLMGSPMLQDPFHPDQWNYYYSFSKAGDDPKTYHIRLYFEDNRLARFEGNLPENTTPHIEALDIEPPETPDIDAEAAR